MTGRATRWLSAAAMIAAVSAALTACGGSTSSGSGNFPTNVVLPTGVPSQSVDPSISGSQLLTASLNDVAKAKAFRVMETTTTKGVTTKIDMRYASTGSAGTITTGKSTLQLIHIGASTYVKAPDAFWKSQLTSTQLSNYASNVHNAWVRVPLLGSTFGQLSAFTDKQQIVDALLHKDTSKFLRGPKKIVDGVSTVRLTNSSTGTVVYVADTGKPYPIQVIGSKTSSAVAHFSEWDTPFAVAVPPNFFALPGN